MGAFVYMLRYSDGSLYIGSATGEDVAPRVDQHNAGAFPDSYTWSRRPVTLIWSEHFERITDAIAATDQRLETREEVGAGGRRLGTGASACETSRRTPSG